MRLFVAAELPGVVADALSAWTPRHDALRPVPVESLHVTPAFLGARSADDARAVGALLPALARPVRDLALCQVRWLPPRRPGVLAVELADPTGALRSLQSDLVQALVEGIGFEPERRPFLPHVTVARVRRGRAAAPGRAVAPALPELAPFAVPCVTLFESRSSSQGSRYLALERVRL